MDSAKKMKTPKSKKKNLTTPRQGPDGTSVMKKKLTLSQKANGIQSNKKKRASDQENLSPPHSAVGAKKKKKHKLSDDEWDVDETISSVSSKRSKITQDDDSEIEIDVDESIAPQIAKHKAMKSAKKNKAGKKKSSETKMETDVTFEQAVEKARGLPDGADEGDESNEEEAMEIQENKPKLKKPKAAEKKKKGIISSAAKKIKKIAGKSEGLKAQKRKSTDGGGDTPEKVKPEHMKRKERKNMRKMNETDNYAMAARSKQIWNELRRMDLPNEKRVELSNELYKMVGGKVKTMVFAHDTSRVIQCLIKYGTQEHKNAIFEELKDNIVELCKSKYAKFFVRKLLKYGTKGQRLHVFQSLYGNVRKLIKHKEACETIELAYNEYANAQQRHAFIEEFYGPSFAVFKTDEIKTLDQILATHPEKANSILNNMKDSLTSLVDKTLLQYSIVHRIFLDYFLHAPAKARSEMIEVVREHLVHMVHTKEGARVAMMCLWSGTAKDRKAFIKSLKTFVVKICKEEYGHLALLALFDCVDDTKIVHKVILEEMLKSLPEVAQDQYGRKVLLYLLSPRDKKNFHPDIIKLLEPADDPVQNPHSKKEASARRGELLDAVSRPLVQYVAHNAKALVSDNAMLILLLNIITHVKSDPTDAMRAVALLAAEPFAIDSEHIIEQTAGHLTMKKLIVNDGERMKQGQQVLFSSILLDILPEGALKSWAACNRGCFILCFLLELKHEEITTKVQKELSGIKNSLQKMEFKGAHILLQKLT